MKTTTSFLVLALLLSTVVAVAQPQQSANFRIPKSALDASGGSSASTDFHLVSALGQSSPIGRQTSTDFVLYGGFLSPQFGVGALSPIQHLVILPNQPNVGLWWDRVSGAASYKVYRSIDPLFTPAPANLLGTASDTTFTDVGAVNLPAVRYYYIVTASSATGALIAVRQRKLEPAAPTMARYPADRPTARAARRAVTKK